MLDAASPLIPLTLGFTFLVIAGCWEFCTYKVPNWLVLCSLASALIFGFVRSLWGGETVGGVGVSSVCCLLAAGLLLPAYSTSGLGAGCVKAHGAFGAWLGCAFNLNDGMLLILFATTVAVIVAGLAWFSTLRFRDVTTLDTDPHRVRPYHGQLPLSVGMILGVILCMLF